MDRFHHSPQKRSEGVTGGCAGALETHSTHATESRVPTTVVTPTAWCATSIICATVASDPARTPGALANRSAWRQLCDEPRTGFDRLSPEGVNRLGSSGALTMAFHLRYFSHVCRLYRIVNHQLSDSAAKS